MHRAITLIALSSFLLAPSQSLAAAELDLSAKVAPLAQPLIDDGEVVGLVIGIVKDGQMQILSYGEMHRGQGDKPDADTIYEIGSVTKALTGVLLADMIERKVVAGDDPVQKFLPDGLTMPIAGDKPITLEHLSTHTSGLPRLPSNFAPADPADPYADYAEERMFDFLKTHKLRRAPGKHEYSNYGAALLGQLLARKAGLPYETLLADRIAKPLGMTDTGIKLTEGMRKRLAPPYDTALEPVKNWDLDAFAPAGGVRSSTRDMLKLAEACLKEDDTPLSKALQASFKKRIEIGGGQAMGLGWFIAGDGITRWHNGMTGGYSTWFAVVPQFKIATVVMANTATTRVAELGEDVTRLAFGIDVRPRVRRKAIEVEADVLKSYVGTYRMAPTFALTVTLEDGLIMVQATAQQKSPIYAETKTKFFSKVVDAQFSFVPKADGKIDKLILHQNGQDMEAKREK